MWEHAKWIGVPEEEIKEKQIFQGDTGNRFAYFRCNFEAPEDAELTVDISANSRYRLWVNGKAVLSGPLKGDEYRQYYETVELTPYLQTGENVIAAQVLLCDPFPLLDQYTHRTPVLAVRSLCSRHLLAVEGTLRKRNGKSVAEISTGAAPWKVWLDNTWYLKETKINENLGGITEKIDFSKTEPGWKKVDFSAEHWKDAEVVRSVKQDVLQQAAGFLDRLPMRKRPIPLLEEIHSRDFIQVAASEEEILLDAGEITNAYMIYHFEGGKGAEVKFTYFEAFRGEEEDYVRTDSEQGEIQGLTDTIYLNGGPLTYEPFWYRTFRYLKIQIRPGKEPLTMSRPEMAKTGYPLEIQTTVSSSEKWVEKVYEMCTRTLKRCMTETYMDCPFYEQMQFVMDTRLEALYTYVVNTDVRMAEKALEDFHNSRIPEGLVQGKYPGSFPQIITTFSLYYIFMIQDYYEQTGDLAVIRKYRSDIDAILEYFQSRIGKTGLVETLDYWPFVDWQKQWLQTGGCPEALLTGPSTIINLMYAYALHSAAELNRAEERTGLAEEYESRRSKILDRVHQLCWSEKREMYREGPSLEQYSQHAQSWAVLNDLPHQKLITPVSSNLSLKISAKMMEHSFAEDVLQCSFSTSFELFRALEKAGMYEKTEQLMMQWAKLTELGCTTCPEVPGKGRSECHAWSALPMYEIVRSIAGIRCGIAGWKSVRIHPHMEYLPELKGHVITPTGQIEFDYCSSGDHRMEYRILLPKGLPSIFEKKNGEVLRLKEGMNCIKE